MASETTARQQPRRQGGGASSADFRSRGLELISGAQDRRLFGATRAIVLAARGWRKVANDEIKPSGQTMARWETLFHVAVADEELTQRELARLIGVEGPTMARMLDRLAQDGLIERRQGESDRRVTRNRITPEGAEVVDAIMAFTNRLRDDVLGKIDPARLAICVEVLEEIVERLERRR